MIKLLIKTNSDLDASSYIDSQKRLRLFLKLRAMSYLNQVLLKDLIYETLFYTANFW